MNVLVIGGFGMSVLDGAAYWSQSAAGCTFRFRECVQNGGANVVTADDVRWADALGVFSYGCSSLWELLEQMKGELAATGKRFKRLFIIAGVPDAFKGQFYGSLWHAPDFIDRVFCFQVDAAPASEQLRNEGVENVKFVDVHEATSRWVNADCNSLVMQFGPVGKHTHIQNTEYVLLAIRRELEAA